MRIIIVVLLCARLLPVHPSKIPPSNPSLHRCKMVYLENQVAEKKGALTKVEGLDATFTKVAVHQKLQVYHFDPFPYILDPFTLFSLFLALTHNCVVKRPSAWCLQPQYGNTFTIV